MPRYSINNNSKRKRRKILKDFFEIQITFKSEFINIYIYYGFQFRHYLFGICKKVNLIKKKKISYKCYQGSSKIIIIFK